MEIRYFIDMDGVIARFYDDPDNLKKMYRRGYYKNLKEHKAVLTAIKMLIRNGKEVYILSRGISPNSIKEKRQWLKAHIPEISEDHMILIDNGTNKHSSVPNGIKATDVLVDDYSEILKDWEKAGGIPVKVINNINEKTPNWKGRYIRNDIAPEEIYKYLILLMIPENCETCPV